MCCGIAMRRVVILLLCSWLNLVTSKPSDLYCPPRCSCTHTSINCKEAQLTSVPDFDLVSSTVTNIDLSKNEIDSIAMSNFVYGHLLNVESLDLSKNNILVVEETSFAALANLKYLNLSHNMLEKLPSRVIEKNKKIESLDLTKNVFSVTTPTLISRSLRKLYLPHCKIAHFNETHLSGLPNLQHLDLSANSLTHIPHSAFDRTKIHHVNLSYNRWRCNCESVRLFHHLTKQNFTVDGDPICFYSDGHSQILEHGRFCNVEQKQHHAHVSHVDDKKATETKHSVRGSREEFALGRDSTLQSETKKIELNAQIYIAIGIILVMTIATTALVTWVCVVGKMTRKHKKNALRRNLIYKELHT